MNRIVLCLAFLVMAATVTAEDRYLGQYGGSPYATPKYEEGYASSYSGSKDSPKLYDNDGNFRGNLNTNRYDPDSVSNPYGRYGSKYSSDSINNPHGVGSRFNDNSPKNRFGSGLRVFGR